VFERRKIANRHNAPVGRARRTDLAVVPDLERELDELYGLPLGEFTAARNELAKELRADGKADAAAWVKALRKPTRAAWVTNQLRARRRKDLADALERGAELRGLQEKLLAGKVDRERLREAARAEQQAIESLMRTAEAIAREHGAGPQILDRVAETLQAAASDPRVAEAIEKGRVEREARATSLGLVGPATSAAKAPSPRKGAKGAGTAKAGKGEAERAAKAERAERESRREATKRRRAAERALSTAEKRIEREREMVERLRGEVADRERRIADAEAEAERAREVLKKLG
jgi:hypothetical protein